MATITPDLRECIDACNESIEATNACLSTHVGEEAMADCLRLCLDCTDLLSTGVGINGAGLQLLHPGLRRLR